MRFFLVYILMFSLLFAVVDVTADSSRDHTGSTRTDSNFAWPGWSGEKYTMFEEIYPVPLEQLQYKYFIHFAPRVLGGVGGAVYDSKYPKEGVNTNYDADVGDFTPGGTDADDRPWFQPSPTNHNYMVTDMYAPSISEIEEYIMRVENHGFKIKIMNNFDSLISDGSDPRIQMAVNQVFGEPGVTAFEKATIYFPPFYDKPNILSSTGFGKQYQRRPIILSMNGWCVDNNMEFANDDSAAFIDSPFLLPSTAYYPLLVAGTWALDGRGAIVAHLAGGGCGSVGGTREYQKNVAEIIDILANEYGGDRHKVIVKGSSRGATVAGFITGEYYEGEPDFPPYSVIGIFATAPALMSGELSQTPLAMNPTFGGAYGTSLGDGANRYDHDPAPLSNPAPVLWPIMGTMDVEEANARSYDGTHVEHFRKVYSYWRFGTFDSWMPEKGWFGFDNKLSEEGIAHTTAFTLNRGHNKMPDIVYYDQTFSQFVTEAMLNPNFDPTEFVPDDVAFGIGAEARDYYYKGNLHDPRNEDIFYLLEDQEHTPLTVNLPLRMGKNVRDDLPADANQEPGMFQIIGEPGRAFRIEIYDDTGTMVAEHDGVIGEDDPEGPYREYAEYRWMYEGLPNMDDTDYFNYRFFYEDEFGNLEDISSYTNSHSEQGVPFPLRTELSYDQPSTPNYFPFPGVMYNFGLTWCETCPVI